MNTGKPINYTRRITGLVVSAALLLSGWTACQRGAGTTGEHVADPAQQVVDDAGYEWGAGETEEVTLDADETAAILQFEEDSHNFGVVTEGKKVEHEYVFT